MSDINNQFADELRLSHAAVRVATQWMGVSKTLSKEQKKSAAAVFDAEGESISASKKILNTKHAAWRAVNKVKSEFLGWFKDNTLPFPEQGIRLLKRGRLDEFNVQANCAVTKLDQAVAHLQDEYHQLREAARAQLGGLFNEDDYPAMLDGEFCIAWDFPSLDPPDYLKDIAPRLYEQQRERCMARFDQAIELAEAGFAEELQNVIAHLAERLTGDNDGQPKQFKESTLSNVLEFFERFKSLSLRSSADLDALVQRAQNVCQGVTYDALQNNGHVRDIVGDAMSSISSDLGQMMELRPSRMISFED